MIMNCVNDVNKLNFPKSISLAEFYSNPNFCNFFLFNFITAKVYCRKTVYVFRFMHLSVRRMGYNVYKYTLYTLYTMYTYVVYISF